MAINMLNIFGMQADCRKRDAYSFLGSSGTLEPAMGIILNFVIDL